MEAKVLQQAVEQVLRERGWTVMTDGRVLAGEKDGEEALLGFIRRGDATAFVDRCAESSAALGAVLMEPLPADEIARLEEAGVACFSREDMEDVVLMAWFQKGELAAAPFVRFLEGT